MIINVSDCQYELGSQRLRSNIPKDGLCILVEHILVEASLNAVYQQIRAFASRLGTL